MPLCVALHSMMRYCELCILRQSAMSQVCSVPFPTNRLIMHPRNPLPQRSISPRGWSWIFVYTVRMRICRRTRALPRRKPPLWNPGYAPANHSDFGGSGLQKASGPAYWLSCLKLWRYGWCNRFYWWWYNGMGYKSSLSTQEQGEH